MALQTGKRLRAQNSTCEVIVVRGADGAGTLTCGGVAMSEDATGGDARTGAAGEPVQLGKRYVDPADSVEILCTKAGPGPLELDGAPLAIKAAKALPSSD